MKRNAPVKWLVVGVIVTISVIVIGTLKIDDSLVYFYTPAEAFAKAPELTERNIRIGALVKPDTVEWNREALELKFILTDFEGHEIAVQHRGTPPDMFREGQGVVVEGRMNADASLFESRRLLVKHSEEYKKPDDHTMTDRALLEASLFRGQRVDTSGENYDYDSDSSYDYGSDYNYGSDYDYEDLTGGYDNE